MIIFKFCNFLETLIKNSSTEILSSFPLFMTFPQILMKSHMTGAMNGTTRVSINNVMTRVAFL